MTSRFLRDLTASLNELCRPGLFGKPAAVAPEPPEEPVRLVISTRAAGADGKGPAVALRLVRPAEFDEVRMTPRQAVDLIHSLRQALREIQESEAK